MYPAKQATARRDVKDSVERLVRSTPGNNHQWLTLTTPPSYNLCQGWPLNRDRSPASATGSGRSTHNHNLKVDLPEASLLQPVISRAAHTCGPLDSLAAL